MSAYDDLLDELAEGGNDDLNLPPLTDEQFRIAVEAHPDCLDDAMGSVRIDNRRLAELIGQPKDCAAYIGVAVYAELLESIRNRVGLDLFMRNEPAGDTGEADNRNDAALAELRVVTL